MKYNSKTIERYKRCCDLCGKDYKKGTKNNRLIFIYTRESYHNGNEWDNEVSFDFCDKCKEKLKLTIQTAQTPHSLYETIRDIVKYGKSEYIGTGYDSPVHTYHFDEVEIITTSYEDDITYFQK